MSNQDVMTEIKNYMAELVAKQEAPVEVEAMHVAGHMKPLTSFGGLCLWVGFACMAASSLYFLSHALNRKASQRNIEMLTFFITAIATLAYLTMASGYGVMDTHTRQPFFYARYIDWLFTTPLMVWDLMELTGADAMSVFTVVGLDALMIVCGIIGSLLVEASVKWAFFVLGCVFFLMVCKELQNGLNKGVGDARGLYATVTYLTIASWTCYPVVWALCEGGDLVGVNASCLLYTVMDVTSKCLFGILIVSNREALDAIYNAKEGYAGVKADAEENAAM